jgi:hypothetical protein
MTSESVVKSVVAIKLSDIVFDEGLYPRVKGHDPEVPCRPMRVIWSRLKNLASSSASMPITSCSMVSHRMLAYKKLNDGNRWR